VSISSACWWRPWRVSDCCAQANAMPQEHHRQAKMSFHSSKCHGSLQLVCGLGVCCLCFDPVRSVIASRQLAGKEPRRPGSPTFAAHLGIPSASPESRIETLPECTLKLSGPISVATLQTRAGGPRAERTTLWSSTIPRPPVSLVLPCKSRLAQARPCPNPPELLTIQRPHRAYKHRGPASRCAGKGRHDAVVAA
jgi:hypothetical protein